MIIYCLFESYKFSKFSMAMKRNLVVIVLGMAMFLCAQADGYKIGDKLKKIRADVARNLKDRGDGVKSNDPTKNWFDTTNNPSADKGPDVIEKCSHDNLLTATNGRFDFVRSLGGKATLTCYTE
eukprot:415375_1